MFRRLRKRFIFWYIVFLFFGIPLVIYGMQGEWVAISSFFVVVGTLIISSLVYLERKGQL